MALLRVRKGASPGTEYPVFTTRQHTVIGREGQVDVPLGDARASRRHAAVSLAHGYWVLQDLESRNGTLLDGKKIEKAILKDGAQIQVGATLLSFHEKETAAPPGIELHGASLVESLREESGVFTFRAYQAAMDRAVRVDWLHPSRTLDEDSTRAVERGIADASKLRGPSVLPFIDGVASPGTEGVFVIHRCGTWTSLEDRLPDLLAGPLEVRIEVFRQLTEVLLERAAWESLRFPVGPAHVALETAADGCPIVLVPALDLGPLIASWKGTVSHLASHAHYLPPEHQAETPAASDMPLAGAMYNLGAVGYHLLTGQKPMGEGDVRAILAHHRDLRPAPANLIEPRVPEEISLLLERMLEKEPGKRPRGRQEVMASIGSAAAGRAAPGPGGGGAPPDDISPPPPARDETPRRAARPARGAATAPAGGQRETAPPPASAGPATLRRTTGQPEVEEAAHGGLLYLPVWMLVWVALFFGARYLTKLFLAGIEA
jgi:hypothetical protein